MPVDDRVTTKHKATVPGGHSSPLAICRRSRGLSQRQLAAKSGIRHETICRLEAGLRGPRWTTAQALARALEVPESVLFTVGGHGGGAS